MAKSVRKTIALIAIKYKIPGNLYAKFQLENVDLIVKNSKETNIKIAAYCTDIQRENPETPEIVTQFLLNRERIRYKE